MKIFLLIVLEKQSVLRFFHPRLVDETRFLDGFLGYVEDFRDQIPNPPQTRLVDFHPICGQNPFRTDFWVMKNLQIGRRTVFAFNEMIPYEIIWFCLILNFRRRLFMGRKEVKLYSGDLSLILTTSRGCRILDSSRKMFKVNVEGPFEKKFIKFYLELSNIHFQRKK